jgi:integrase
MTSQGIETRHGKDCRAHDGGRCNCTPSYRAGIYDKRAGRKIYSGWVKDLGAARTWRQDALVAQRKGTMVAPTARTVDTAARELIAGMQDGSIRTPSGDTYKPSVPLGYERNLRNHVLPTFGNWKLSDVRRNDLQDWVDRMVAAGKSPSLIGVAVAPLRVIYRRAVKRGELAVNPTTGLDVPADRSRRERIATPTEAAALIAALSTTVERAVWGTAFYAGLRLGELQALRWSDVDLAAGTIRVERSYNREVRQFSTPKTKAGRRTVPIVGRLRDLLLDLRLDQAKTGADTGLVFGFRGVQDRTSARSAAMIVYTPDAPFPSVTADQRAKRAWDAAELNPIGFHECRHTCASLLIAAMADAGKFNPKLVQSAMGHANIAMTYDRYGHLFPGSESELGGMLDAYLAKAAAEAIRVASIDEIA